MKRRRKDRAARTTLAVKQAAVRARKSLERDYSEEVFPRGLARLPGLQTLERLTRSPRQLALGNPTRKRTLLLLERIKGRPIGRRTRAKLVRDMPTILAETLCKRKRIRRAVLHARKAVGRGKAVSAQRKLLFGGC